MVLAANTNLEKSTSQRYKTTVLKKHKIINAAAMNEDRSHKKEETGSCESKKKLKKLEGKLNGNHDSCVWDRPLSVAVISSEAHSHPLPRTHMHEERGSPERR